MFAGLTPWHILLYRIDELPCWKISKPPSTRHIAFWDEWQYLPIPDLDKHLLLVLERSPTEGQAALNYLSSTRQRWAADCRPNRTRHPPARALRHPSRISPKSTKPSPSAISAAPPTPSSAASTASAKTPPPPSTKPAPTTSALPSPQSPKSLDALIRELTRSSDKYAVRFRPIAQRWSRIIALHIQDLTQAAEQRQEIDSPYIIGVPLTERQEIFVGRIDISARIEQLLLDRRRPPLLLYGQRRTGKTSLLHNLGRLLPNSVVPLFVDLQGPASSASDHAGFLYNLARGMATSAQRQRSLSLPPLSRETLTADPFTSFDEWLDAVEATLQGSTALLTFDEFEVLDQALTTGRFSETLVLGMLRNLIQHRPRFKVLFAGSHTLEEFQRWSSYLINAQTLHLGYLKDDETRQLIERPSADLALRYRPEACDRVLALTKGHPFLVQLLCAEIVVLKNEQDPSVRRLATLKDVNAAVPEALSSGSMFFSDIEGNQLSETATKLLHYMAAQGEGAIANPSALAQHCDNADFAAAIALLQQRELIDAAEERVSNSSGANPAVV